MSEKKIIRKISIFINGKQVENNLGSVGRAVGTLRKELSKLTPGTQAFIDKSKQLKDVKRQYASIKREIEGVPGLFKRMSNSVGGFMGAFGIGLGLTGIIGGLRKLTTINVELAEAQADVMKTTGLTKKGVDDLTKSLKKIDTRTGITELLGLAESAGRLNITGKVEIENFVRETDKAFVALGDSLEGSAADIGLTLGKLANNFNLEEKYGIGESLNKIGSTINELGANSKASEGPIVDFTKRLAGVADQAGISLPNIAALGALFDENGQSVEVSATTFNKLLPAIGKNVTKFAKIAGVDVKEFKKILEEDAFEALKLVAKGAQSNQRGLLGLTETLKNYGIDSARAASIVGILSSKTERLSELQKISNDAFIAGTSLTQEFNVKNNTLGAILSKIGNTISQKFTGSGTQNFLKGIAAGFLSVISPAESLVDSIKNEQVELNILFTKLTNVNIKGKERQTIIDNLQKNYGDYIGNIDLEKASTQQLSDVLETINNQYINRIILQRKLDEAQVLGNKAADAAIFIEDKRAAAINTLIEAETALGIKVDLSKTKWERRNIALDAANKNTGLFKIEANKLQKSLDFLSKDDLTGKGGFANGVLTKAKSDLAALNAEIENFKKDNGLINTTKQTGGTPTATKNGGVLKGDLTKKEKAAQTSLTEFLKAEQIKRETNDLDALNKELALIDEKFRLKIEKAKANGLNTDALEAERDLQKEELKLLRTREFEDRKRELQNQIDLENAETEEEKKILKAEQNLIKHQLELDRISLNETEKATLKKLLKVKSEKVIAGIEDKFRKKKQKADRDTALKNKKWQQDSLNSAIRFAGEETRVGSALLAVKGIMAARESLINLGLLKAKVATSAGKATASIAEGQAATAKVGFPQNIPLLLAFAAQVAGIIGSIKAASGMGKSAQLPRFNTGGYTSSLGFKDQTGHDVAGVVHAQEYVIPAAVLEQAEVAPIVQYLEAKRTNANTFVDGGATTPSAPSFNAETSTVIAPQSNDLLIATLIRATEVLEKLEEDGIVAYMSRDLQNAKLIRDDINDYEKLRNKNKL